MRASLAVFEARLTRTHIHRKHEQARCSLLPSGWALFCSGGKNSNQPLPQCDASDSAASQRHCRVPAWHRLHRLPFSELAPLARTREPSAIQAGVRARKAMSEAPACIPHVLQHPRGGLGDRRCSPACKRIFVQQSACVSCRIPDRAHQLRPSQECRRSAGPGHVSLVRQVLPAGVRRECQSNGLSDPPTEMLLARVGTAPAKLVRHADLLWNAISDADGALRHKGAACPQAFQLPQAVAFARSELRQRQAAPGKLPRRLASRPWLRFRLASRSRPLPALPVLQARVNPSGLLRQNERHGLEAF